MTEEQIQNRVEELQKDFHELTMAILKESTNKKITWYDANQVALFRKLAEIELKIEEYDNSRISK